MVETKRVRGTQIDSKKEWERKQRLPVQLSETGKKINRVRKAVDSIFGSQNGKRRSP